MQNAWAVFSLAVWILQGSLFWFRRLKKSYWFCFLSKAKCSPSQHLRRFFLHLFYIVGEFLFGFFLLWLTVTIALWINSAVKEQMPFIKLCNQASLHRSAYFPYRLIYKKCDAFACVEAKTFHFFWRWIRLSVVNDIRLCFYLESPTAFPMNFIIVKQKPLLPEAQLWSLTSSCISFQISLLGNDETCIN